MTKRERAIVMAYTGGVTFTNDDIGYFLEYVKEKTGIELKVLDWSSTGVPSIYFGPNTEETVEKIRKACKEDFDNLIERSNEEENKKNERDKNSKLFFKKLKRLQQLLGKELRPDKVLLLAIFESLEIVKGDEGKENVILAGSSEKVSISLRASIDMPNPKEEFKDKDAERFAKRMVALEQLLGRDLRPDELMLLALFASAVNASEDDKKDAKDDTLHVNGRRNGKNLFSKKMEALEHRFGRPLRPDEALLLIMFDSIKVDSKKDEDLFIKKIKALEQRFGRDLRPSEALLLTLFDSIDVDKVDEGKEDPSHIMPWGRTADLAITLALLDVALGKDLESELKKASKLENEITLTAGPVSEDTLKDLFKPMDECCCDKKEKSEKKASNHEFSDAIAEAALEICGIDLKKGDKND